LNIVGQFFVFLLPAVEKVALVLSPEADYPEVFVVSLCPSKKMLITIVSSPTIEHCVTYIIGTNWLQQTLWVGFLQTNRILKICLGSSGIDSILLTEGSILDLCYEVCQ